MNEQVELLRLQKENEQLKADNEVLLKIIAQMKTTLNSLINRYMTQTDEKETA